MLTLERAIYLSAYPLNMHREGSFYDYRDAVQMGIQAMRLIRRHRKGEAIDFLAPLPGESEEVRCII